MVHVDGKKKTPEGLTVVILAICVNFYRLSSVVGFSTKSLELPSCRA